MILNYYATRINKAQLKKLNQLTYLWGNYRSTASPIFDWLYWITQKNMNMDMIVDGYDS